MSHWCRDVQRDEAVRAAEDEREGPLPTLEEAISGVTERRPPEPGGGGNVTGRVTLEITHDGTWGHPSSWPWFNSSFLAWVRSRRGELVRVVEEDRPGVIDQDGDRVQMSWRELAEALRFERGQARAERDAAIRERDKLRGEITSVLDRSEFASMELTRLRNRVAELESAPAASGAARAEAAG